MLLALVCHAFLVGATHFHRVQKAEGAPSAAAISRQGGGEQSPPSGGHAQCLLCRLQRNFISDLQHSAPALAAPVCEAAGRADLPATPAHGAYFPAPSGRAPPLA